MKKEPCIGGMGILIDMIVAVGVESACPTDQSVDFIAFVQQKLRHIKAIPAGDACNWCFAHLTFPCGLDCSYLIHANCRGYPTPSSDGRLQAT